MRRTALWLLPLLLAAAVVLMPLLGGRDAPRADTAAAVSRLRELESGDPNAVQETIRGQARVHMEAARESIRQDLLSGKTDVWSMFRDFAIVGDSRIYGFGYNGFLPEERVLARVSETVLKLEEHIPELVALNPARLYVGYGSNELEMPELWPTPESYADEMAEALAKVEAALPGIEIYVNSIMEILPGGYYPGDRWDQIGPWNDALRAMCEAHGYVFVDNDRIAAEHHDLYYDDGEHFYPEFYNYWGANLIMATYYPEEELEP